MNLRLIILLAALFLLVIVSGYKSAVEYMNKNRDVPKLPEALDSVFGLPRSPETDIVNFKNKDTLTGTVMDEKISIQTPYGTATFSLRYCVGISFGNGEDIPDVIYTINNNRLSGKIADITLKLRSNLLDAPLEVECAAISTVILKKNENESTFISAFQVTNIFVMANSDVLTAAILEEAVDVATDYAKMKLAVKDIGSFEIKEKGSATCYFTLRNGNRIQGKIESEHLSLKLDLGMQFDSIAQDKFVKMYFSRCCNLLQTVLASSLTARE